MDRRKLEKVFEKQGITPESVSGLSETATIFLNTYKVTPEKVKSLSRKYGEKILETMNKDANWADRNVKKPEYSRSPERPLPKKLREALIMAAAAKGDPEHIMRVAAENSPVIKNRQNMFAAAVHNDPELVTLFAERAKQPHVAKNPNKLISIVKELRKEKTTTRSLDETSQLGSFLSYFKKF